MLRILIVEDEAHNREALTELVKRLGHEAETAVDGQEGLEKVLQTAYDLVLSDVRMPRVDGLQLFENFQRLETGELRPEFAFMTAYGQIDEAVGAMRKGALHFLQKPLRKKDLTSLLDEVSRIRSWKGESRSNGAADLIHESKAFSEIVRLVDKVALSQASVVFVGESGTGKEVLARRLHAASARADRPLIAFHSGAIPETLVESELFGHEKGAFTGADQARLGLIRQAHGGSFFWDELSTMPAAIQAKLLRVIQDREVQGLGSRHPVHVDVRWIAASNEPLEPLVKAGRFREDLLYRLSVVVIDLPPLRTRPEDIDGLAESFMRSIADREGRAPLAIPMTTREILRTYPWPGNVRELKNVIERAFVLSSGNELSVDLLPPHLTHEARSHAIQIALGSSLATVEDRLIEETLRFCEGDKNRAALILGVAPRTIYRWIERRSAEPPS